MNVALDAIFFQELVVYVLNSTLRHRFSGSGHNWGMSVNYIGDGVLVLEKQIVDTFAVIVTT